MNTVLIAGAVCIAVILMIPSGNKKNKKKKSGHGTETAPPSAIKFVDYIYMKLKQLIGG